jgi:hypothetical protein
MNVLLPELWFHVIVPFLDAFRDVLALARTCCGLYALLWPKAVCQHHVPTDRTLATALRRGFEEFVLPYAQRVHTLHGRVYYRLCGPLLERMAHRLTTVYLNSEFSCVSDNTLCKLVNITTLDVRNNRTIQMEAIRQLPRLRRLWINGPTIHGNGYHMGDITAILPVTLEFLAVDYLPIGMDFMLQQLPNLRRLSLAMSRYEVADAVLLGMTQLTHLQLANKTEYPLLVKRETLMAMAQGWLECLDISHANYPQKTAFRKQLKDRIASGALCLITRNKDSVPCAAFEPPGDT